MKLQMKWVKSCLILTNLECSIFSHNPKIFAIFLQAEKDFQILTVFLIEICNTSYCFQFFNFYKKNLEALNPI